MVFRIFVEKKPELAHEAQTLLADLRTFLQLTALENLRVINRYDVEGVDAALFETCKTTVFSEPQLDVLSQAPALAGAVVFATEYLPGQFDQRADSAAQCIQMISCGERPSVRTAKIYALYGKLTQAEIDRIKAYVINPVEAREASLAAVSTLCEAQTAPPQVAVLRGFLTLDEAALSALTASYGLAMDLEDLKFCQAYFQTEQRDPTVTELRVIDTYWSDHCRHTTFLTTLDHVHFENALLQTAYEDYLATRTELGRTKPVNLMDVGTLAAKYLKQTGYLEKLDESEEINACTVKIDVDVDGEMQKWLLLFKNETHNHPTEIEPFGGAATCIGGAIRDPLSGRGYVYAAMRVSGAGNPLSQATLPGKLSQRKLVTTAAAGYSGYGNQIGLATGQVDELYHEGYRAKHMEIGAVIAATPAENVRRERPQPGDRVILLGGKTGRDGCGGATGSSKSHSQESLASCGAEVQKGNAPEERKLQRLFRNKEATGLIKRCNDFGAGGVCVAIGELAGGLHILLDAIPKKYDGLDGTELAISESQERMAVVVETKDVPRFLQFAQEENLEATPVAQVTSAQRLVMDWKGQTVVNLSRAFLDTNGAEKHTDVTLNAPLPYEKPVPSCFSDAFFHLAADLNVCSKRGLSQRFDSTIGAGTVLLPFGGSRQLTPPQAMVHKIPVEHGDTNTCSLMSWGCNPFITEKSPYHGAYLAVVESVCKLIATGAEFSDIYLSFQEYFEKPNHDPKRWGKPLAALLGAFAAQKDLKIAAIGGKDSMSGSFEALDVPPTLVCFAVTTGRVDCMVSPEFKAAGHRVCLLRPERTPQGLPEPNALRAVFARVTQLLSSGKACAAYTPTYGGAAEGLMKMAFGNHLGLALSPDVSMGDLFGYEYGAFLLELTCGEEIGLYLGQTTAEPSLSLGGETLSLDALLAHYEKPLESVYPCNSQPPAAAIPIFSHEPVPRTAPAIKVARPRMLIPVFPGTNCEYDTAKAAEQAGAEAEIFVVNNLCAAGISRSVEAFAQRIDAAQMVVIPGGFSGGDEPDGSGKFITAFFRNAAVARAVTELLERRDGLMCGICNGFQALIKLGLVPYGKIVAPDESSPTLSYNTIGRHQSLLVRTRIVSNQSPWLQNTRPGACYTVPISHGEGRFLADEKLILQLAQNGQIATQYVDENNQPTNDIRFNPNNSAFAIEGITSPDGRVFGKMGHSERIGRGLYKNVVGDYDMGMFRAAVQYFQ